MENAWYLVRTKPRQEFQAALNLEAQGFEVYFPQYTVKERSQALFPSYVFVRTNTHANYSKVAYTRGVQNFVKFGTWLATLPDGVVKMIKDKELETSVQARELLQINQGDVVEILGGPLQGFNAIFEGYTAEGRVRVLFDLLSHQQSIELEERWVSLLRRSG